MTRARSPGPGNRGTPRPAGDERRDRTLVVPIGRRELEAARADAKRLGVTLAEHARRALAAVRSAT